MQRKLPAVMHALLQYLKRFLHLLSILWSYLRLLFDSLAVFEMAFDRLLLPLGYPIFDYFGIHAPCKQASIHGHIEDYHIYDAHSDLLADVAGHDIRTRACLRGAHEGTDDNHEDKGNGSFIESLQGIV